MSNKLMSAVLAAIFTMTATTPVPALAQNSQYHRHHNYSRDREYRGRGGYYRRKCGGGNGAVGTVAGGAGGALIGNALGGGTLGTVAGGVGGALLGRHFDKKNTRARNGC